jgi:AcrR family transcriptional regulator
VSDPSRPATAKGQRAAATWKRAGREAFAERGFLNTKISDIAAGAGMSVASFYNYFPTKEDLLLALAADYHVEVVRRSESRLEHVDLHADIRAVVGTFWDVYVDEQALMQGVFQMSMLDDAFRDRWVELRRPTIDGIADLLQRSGPSPNLDTRTTALALSSMLEHFCYLWANEQIAEVRGRSAADMVAEISDLWFRVIAPSTGAGTPSIGLPL